ncbi:MAG: AbrB/MazE/SpoVT family DNA-binding domain-containing protein [Eubacterium sp.]|nr:AbrB/MazE/SpoVT family DNA-binding domain-containing protein [Eubacterium sp.]
MEVTLTKWGNSHGIRIPKEFLASLGITKETPLNIELKNDEITISKKFKHQTLKERVKKSGKPLSFASEIDWGDPEGSEVW